MAGAVKKSYPRSYRIESLIKRELSLLAIKTCPSVNIRRVSLNRDYSIATVYYSLLNDEVDIEYLLTQQTPRWRRQLALSTNMRLTPKLIFTLDTDGMLADDMQKRLNDIDAKLNNT